MNDSQTQPIDRAAYLRRRARSAGTIAQADFLLRRASTDIAERLDATLRTFPRCLNLSGRGGIVSKALSEVPNVEYVITADTAASLLGEPSGLAVICDPEWLPFGNEKLDLVVSVLDLHWVNDLPGTLMQIRRALRPDGLFIGAMIGGDSLTEMRQAFLQADVEMTGGASPRVSPFTDVRDLGALLQRAGFALPVVDTDHMTVRYGSLFDVMADLRKMGGTNALNERSRKPLRRSTLLRAAEIYGDRFSDEDGRVRATVDILHFSGWAPHESQQKPLRPGSAKHRLADALGTIETAAGEQALPAKDKNSPPG